MEEYEAHSPYQLIVGGSEDQGIAILPEMLHMLMQHMMPGGPAEDYRFAVKRVTRHGAQRPYTPKFWNEVRQIQNERDGVIWDGPCWILEVELAARETASV